MFMKESIFCWWSLWRKSRSLKPTMFYFFNSPKQWGRKSRFCWWTHLSTLKEPTILLKEKNALFLLLQLWCIFSVPLTNSQTIWGDRFQLFFSRLFTPYIFFWMIQSHKYQPPTSWLSLTGGWNPGITQRVSCGYFPQGHWSGAGPSNWYSHWQEVLESPSFTWSNIRVFCLGIAPKKCL